MQEDRAVRTDLRVAKGRSWRHDATRREPTHCKDGRTPSRVESHDEFTTNLVVSFLRD